MVILYLEKGGLFMKVVTEKTNETFKKHIEEGHLETYLKDLEYLKGRKG